MASSPYIVTFAVIVLFSGMADLSIVLEGNGYSIVVAISKDIPQPADNGTELIDKLKDLLTEASAILFKATDDKVYFKSIDIVIPPSWKGTEASNTSTTSFQLADIRLNSDSASNDLPHTSHSGKCGVAGDFISLPVEFVMDSEETDEVKAKGLVQQWAQLRYGVFEEHGFPNDDLLPYFYRHPDGYDAVSSSNDTEIKGNLKSLSDDDCEVDEFGIISNQGECRFIPTATGQTATTSLMSFHWLDSVISFSKADKHDKKPPHRQNRLCSSRSSSEIMASLPDFDSIAPIPGQDTKPEFQLLQNKMIPVVYLAIDKSQPSNPNITEPQQLNIFRKACSNLFRFLSEEVPDTLVAWSTFENVDFSDIEGSYLIEELPPTRIQDGKQDLDEKINDFDYSDNVVTRDVSAVIRDAELRLSKYKDVGGSILYIITSNESETNDTVTETNMAEKLLLNNIKLVVVESGENLVKDLFRFSVLSQGSHYFTPFWESTAFFTPINTEILNDCQNGLKTERRMITIRKDSIQTGNPWTGYFSIDETVGSNTTVVLESPTGGSFTVTLTSPSGNILTLEKQPEENNWNDPASSVKVVWQRIPDTTATGRWIYKVDYDSSSCSTCDAEPEIHLQIGSSIRSETSTTPGSKPPLPTFHPWVSLTPGSNSVDLSRHPVVIQARFDYADKDRLGGLMATANVRLNSAVVASVPLFDTGLMDSDISKDGIYSGIFYPEANGIYEVDFHAVHGSSAKGSNRLLNSDQNSYCCGSSLPTTTLNNFEITVNEAVHFEVQNAPSKTVAIVSDFLGNTYGVDQNLVYADLRWTVPFNTISQTVKYSEDYEQLLNNFGSAPEATVEYGLLNDTEAGTSVFVYVSAPYTEGKNVYFVVETTGKGNTKTCSNLFWTERNPPKNVFTTPGPTTPSTTTPSTTTQSTSTLLTTELTELTTTEEIMSSTEPSTEISTISTSDSSSTELPTDVPTSTTDISTDPSSTLDVTSSTISSTPISSTPTISSTDSITTDSTAIPDSTVSTEPTTEEPTTEDPDQGLTPSEIGYIVGGVVGGIVVIGAITGGVIFYKKKQGGISSPSPASNSNYDRSNGREGGYSNSRYPASTPYTSPSGSGGVNNTRQPESLGRQDMNEIQSNEAYDNIGVTIEDDDMLMTAM
ncbi:calcium-activated chloride channel regulator 1-like isoform X2 [Daphnia pulicaria]|uniref:calcium-activated chloride channel regulator 1-like isoform X2 n=1 Tax=Daphnia pulicaria TaxID=35523 RepID=UPI001EEA905C|nr:calcium-activated chloride channel regulator 1-like isoform X2 [Daphnia pulicaria]